VIGVFATARGCGVEGVTVTPAPLAGVRVIVVMVVCAAAR
jgi:hypothetical protein